MSYCWVRSTYAALVNLTRKKLNVVVTDSRSIGMCQFSRFSAKKIRYNDFLIDKNVFLQDIQKILEIEKPELYLPSHDETEIISNNLNTFPASVKIPIPCIENLRIANDKSASQELAERCEIPTAKRINYNSPEEILQLVYSSKKYVIRLRKGNSAKGVFYANGPAEVYQTVKSSIDNFKCSTDRYPVVQEFVQGEGWGVSCLYWEGKRIAHFTHKRLREKTETGGTSTLREHHPNEILEQMAFKILDKLEWHGLAMVEFKYDSVSKKGYFIEINPRLWGSIHLAISAGVEFPYLLYLCATQGPQSAQNYLAESHIKYPWRSRWYLGDCIVAASNLRKLKLGAAIKCILPGETNTYDDINLKDPFAFLGEVLYYGNNFVRHRSINPIEDGMIG